MRTLLLALLASLPMATQGAEVRVKVEFSGGSKTAKLNWDPVIRIEQGTLKQLENAGLDTKDEVWSAKTDTSVRIKAMTEGGADGVILILDGQPTTQVIFESAVLPLTTTLAEISRGPVQAKGDNNALLVMSLAPLSFAAVPSMECATALPAADGGVWALGVRNNGDAKLAATRQELVLGKVVDEQWSETLLVEPAGYVYFSTMVALPDGPLLLAWCRFEQESWQVYAARFADGQLDPPVKLSEGAVNLMPALYAGREGVWCAWQTDSGRQFALRARRFGTQGWGQPFNIPTDGSAARPQLAGDGRVVWLAFDQFVGRDFDVYACRLEGDARHGAAAGDRHRGRGDVATVGQRRRRGVADRGEPGGRPVRRRTPASHRDGQCATQAADAADRPAARRRRHALADFRPTRRPQRSGAVPDDADPW